MTRCRQAPRPCSAAKKALDFPHSSLQPAAISLPLERFLAMITSYSNYQTEATREAILIYKMMHQRGPHPNHFTLSSVLKACSFLKAIREGNQIHAYLTKLGFNSSIYVQTTLLDMYANFDWIQEARKLLHNMSARNIVSCNTMIACYAKVRETHWQPGNFLIRCRREELILGMRCLLGILIKENGFANHGHSEDALKLFPKMLEEGIQPDAVTFLGILTACGHAGLVNVGCQFFDCMSKDYRVERSVDHHACMVDLYGRAGLIEEAYDLVKTMMVEPHAGVWGALLNACRTYCHTKVGEIAARELFRIEPRNPGNYVLLSNMYARARLWDGVTEVRCLMRRKGVSKTAGCSRIEVNDAVHEFLMGDATHPQHEDIYAVLRHLSLLLVQEGVIIFKVQGD